MSRPLLMWLLLAITVLGGALLGKSIPKYGVEASPLDHDHEVIRIWTSEPIAKSITKISSQPVARALYGYTIKVWVQVDPQYLHGTILVPVSADFIRTVGRYTESSHLQPVQCAIRRFNKHGTGYCTLHFPPMSARMEAMFKKNQLAAENYPMDQLRISATTSNKAVATSVTNIHLAYPSVEDQLYILGQGITRQDDSGSGESAESSASVEPPESESSASSAVSSAIAYLLNAFVSLTGMSAQDFNINYSEEFSDEFVDNLADEFNGYEFWYNKTAVATQIGSNRQGNPTILVTLGVLAPDANAKSQAVAVLNDLTSGTRVASNTIDDAFPSDSLVTLDSVSAEDGKQTSPTPRPSPSPSPSPRPSPSPSPSQTHSPSPSPQITETTPTASPATAVRTPSPSPSPTQKAPCLANTFVSLIGISANDFNTLYSKAFSDNFIESLENVTAYKVYWYNETAFAIEARQASSQINVSFGVWAPDEPASNEAISTLNDPVLGNITATMTVYEAIPNATVRVVAVYAEDGDVPTPSSPIPTKSAEPISGSASPTASAEPSGDGNGATIGIIVGAAVAGIVFIPLIVLSVFYIRKKYSNRNTEQDGDVEHNPEQGDHEVDPARNIEAAASEEGEVIQNTNETG